MLFVFNESPWKTERAWHGLRVVTTMALKRSSDVRVFLFGDGVETVASNPDEAPFRAQPYVANLIHSGVRIGVCASCLDARGLDLSSDSPNVQRASLKDAAAWISEANSHLIY